MLLVCALRILLRISGAWQWGLPSILPQTDSWVQRIGKRERPEMYFWYMEERVWLRVFGTYYVDCNSFVGVVQGTWYSSSKIKSCIWGLNIKLVTVVKSIAGNKIIRNRYKQIQSVLSQNYRLPRSTICAAGSSKGICALPAPPDQQLPPLQRFRSVNIFPLIKALLWLYYVNNSHDTMIDTFTSVNCAQASSL